MKKEEKQFNKMKIGDKIKFDIFDVWRVPNGWIFGIDMGETASLQFVPINDMITMESNPSSISDKQYRDLFK